MFTLEKTSNDVKFQQIVKVEPEPELEPGQSDGSGSSQIPRLRAAPAPKPWLKMVGKSLNDRSLWVKMLEAESWVLMPKPHF